MHDLQATLAWLDSWPAGLKLNTELSHFLCVWLRAAVVAWSGTFSYLLLRRIKFDLTNLLSLVTCLLLL